MHEPHCGGRSIEKALMNHAHSDNFNGNHHIPIQVIKLNVDNYDSYLKFRVIRDPRDWLVTCWSRNENTLDFEDWAKTKGLTFKVNGTLFWRYEEVDTTLRLESIQDEINTLFYGMPHIYIEHIGVIHNKPHWSDLTSDKLLRRLYPDISKYNYDL